MKEEEKSPTKAKFRIFLQLNEKIKKASWVPNSPKSALAELFIKKFPELASTLEEHQTPSKVLPPILITHKESKVKYELEDTCDIYEYAILEVSRVMCLRCGEVSGASTIGMGLWGNRRKKLVISMVGLPARGKTFIAQKISRYLNWIGVTTKLFNVGQYRRKMIGAKQASSFYDPENTAGNSARLSMAVAALDELVEWLDRGGRVAIYDATNTTTIRQALIKSRCEQENFELLWVESLCSSPEIIEQNIFLTKLSSPEYTHILSALSLLYYYPPSFAIYPLFYSSFLSFMNCLKKL